MEMYNDRKGSNTDRRGNDRFRKCISAKIAALDKTDDSCGSNRSYEFIIHDLSVKGIYGVLNVPNKNFLETFGKCTNLFQVTMRLTELSKDIAIQVVPVWTRSLNDPIDASIGVGFEFQDITKAEKLTIASYIENLNNEESKDPLDLYPIFIAGTDVDTGRYDYFPYSEKMILEFKQTRQIIRHLKKGIFPENYKDYVFAKYCVNDDMSNVDAIKAAYEAGLIFKKFSLSKRRKILEDIHDLMIANRDEFIKLLVIEGHSQKLAEWEFSGMERCLSRESLMFFTKEMKKVIKNDDEMIILARKPDGVVCLSPPKNAPSSNSLLAAHIFLAGNTIVVKPPLKSPISTIFLWKNVINEALMLNGAPPGCVNIVIGNSKKIMDEWLESPLVNDIIYFGKSDRGMEIGKQAYLNDKKPILELSGNDMFFVWKDADIDKAISSLLDSFLGSTQICMVPKNALIHELVYDEFLERFLKEIKKLKVGLPSDPETYFTPVGNSKDFFDFLEDAIEKGAVLACGGRKIDYNGMPDANGMYLEPTVLKIEDSCKADKIRVVEEENFFPLLPMVKISGNDKEIFKRMKELADLNQYGLRMSVWVNDRKVLRNFVKEFDNAGILKINSRHVAFSMYTSTHGGTRKTGGAFGEMNYIWQKTSHLQGVVIREGS